MTDNTAVGVGLIIGVGLALAGTYVAFRAQVLKDALDKQDGGLLMGVIARFIQMTVVAMWIGVIRTTLRLLDDQGTLGTQTVLQVLSTLLILGTIAWSFVQVRGWGARSEDHYESKQLQADMKARFKIELALIDRMASKGGE
jgi:DNA-binding phage protein